MGLSDILRQFRAVRDDAAAGEYVKAVRDLVPVLEAFCDLAEAVGFKAAPGDEEAKAEIKATMKETLAIVKKKAGKAKGVKGAAPVGKWGDGTMLAKLLELLLKFAPLFI